MSNDKTKKTISLEDAKSFYNATKEAIGGWTKEELYTPTLKDTLEYQRQKIKQIEQTRKIKELTKPIVPKKPTEKEKLATQVSIRKSKEYLADKKKVTKPKTPPANFVKRYFANELNDAEVTYFKKTYIEPEKVYAEKKYLAGGAPSSLAKAKAITYIKQKWGLKYGKYFSPERALFGESPIKEKKEWDKLDLGL